MTREIDTSTVRVGEQDVYLATPRESTGAGMLILPMITGIGERVREFAAELAGHGVTALSWDPFDGVSMDDTPLESMFELMHGLDDEHCLGEMRELLDHMFGELGLQKVGVVGYCLGGRFALLLGAREARLANVVAYHPTVFPEPAANHTVDAFTESARIAAPTMMLYPGQDTAVPREVFDRLQEALQSRTDERAATIVHLYPQAHHGFSDTRSHGAEVNEHAYAVSQPQVLAFVDATTR
ncbi:dienelactone hydrolase [Saccharomonospora sp. CUA-673]|uniref:dienelactone hydrolase family protein n=1 Tax=Saccharomonospora sp. CUA-673 TaxID=1904969 RepID=UPI0009647CF4|nr:dienelactone hydrolase family protein [Saccharomonospora sp. CUA-673]OLT44090.1 dienelactone hydrolase [Saccharomonospora sp. CUA-673]